MRPVKIMVYYPDGTPYIEQEYIDFYEFPDRGFYFPKTIKVKEITNWYHRNKAPVTIINHIEDLHIGSHIPDDLFQDMSLGWKDLREDQ